MSEKTTEKTTEEKPEEQEKAKEGDLSIVTLKKETKHQERAEKNVDAEKERERKQFEKERRERKEREKEKRDKGRSEKKDKTKEKKEKFKKEKRDKDKHYKEKKEKEREKEKKERESKSDPNKKEREKEVEPSGRQESTTTTTKEIEEESPRHSVTSVDYRHPSGLSESDIMNRKKSKSFHIPLDALVDTSESERKKGRAKTKYSIKEGFKTERERRRRSTYTRRAGATDSHGSVQWGLQSHPTSTFGPQNEGQTRFLIGGKLISEVIDDFKDPVYSEFLLQQMPELQQLMSNQIADASSSGEKSTMPTLDTATPHDLVKSWVDHHLSQGSKEKLSKLTSTSLDNVPTPEQTSLDQQESPPPPSPPSSASQDRAESETNSSERQSISNEAPLSSPKGQYTGLDKYLELLNVLMPTMMPLHGVKEIDKQGKEETFIHICTRMGFSPEELSFAATENDTQQKRHLEDKFLTKLMILHSGLGADDEDPVVFVQSDSEQETKSVFSEKEGESKESGLEDSREPQVSFAGLDAHEKDDVSHNNNITIENNLQTSNNGDDTTPAADMATSTKSESHLPVESESEPQNQLHSQSAPENEIAEQVNRKDEQCEGKEPVDVNQETQNQDLSEESKTTKIEVVEDKGNTKDNEDEKGNQQNDSNSLLPSSDSVFAVRSHSENIRSGQKSYGSSSSLLAGKANKLVAELKSLDEKGRPRSHTASAAHSSLIRGSVVEKVEQALIKKDSIGKEPSSLPSHPSQPSHPSHPTRMNSIDRDLQMGKSRSPTIHILSPKTEPVVRSKQTFGFVDYIKMVMFNNMHKNPEVEFLLWNGEDTKSSTPSDILLNWVNYHLRRAKCTPVTNLISDFKDLRALSVLIRVLSYNWKDDPTYGEKTSPKDNTESHGEREKEIATQEYRGGRGSAIRREKEVPEKEENLEKRCELLLNRMKEYGLRVNVKTPTDLMKGNWKLYLSILAAMFELRSNPRTPIDLIAKRHITVAYINQVLEGDPSFVPVRNLNLPFVLKDAVTLCKVINAKFPGTIDLRLLHQPNRKLSTQQIIENWNMCIQSAKFIGCLFGHVEPQDILDRNTEAICSLAWEIVKVSILQGITYAKHPELSALFPKEEDKNDLELLGPERLLMKWLNYHLVKSSSLTPVKDFSEMTADHYHRLLIQLGAKAVPGDTILSLFGKLISNSSSASSQANKAVFSHLSREHWLFVGEKEINLFFLAEVFNVCNGLEKERERERESPMIEGSMIKKSMKFFKKSASREERGIKVWINSLGLSVEVKDLFFDLRDGVVLYQIMQRLRPGCVQLKKLVGDAKEINPDSIPNPTTIFQKLELVGTVLEAAKKIGAMPNIVLAPKDIVDGSKTPTLALLNQLLRYDILHYRESTGIGNQKPFTEMELLHWAVNKVADFGGTTTICNFEDHSVTDGLFLLDLLNACESSTVNYNLIYSGNTYEERLENAKYVINLAWKIGIPIFTSAEDIVEGRPKAIMALIGSIMCHYQSIET